MNSKKNLLNYDLLSLKEFFQEIGEKPFRAQQLLQWIHQQGITDFKLMTNLSFKLRNILSERAEIRPPEILSEQISSDGTRKWLCRLEDANCVEMVFIPSIKEPEYTDDSDNDQIADNTSTTSQLADRRDGDKMASGVYISIQEKCEGERGTLCVSSQVGCPLKCAFCATGALGFIRNLSVAEIIGQLWLANRILTHNAFPQKRIITNVVLMGMGEPLLNLENIVAATNVMMDDLAYGLSKYRVTVSTSGIVPAMWRLRDLSPVALAVSLHAPTDELRNILVPINKHYPLVELLKACKSYYTDRHRMVTFEYVMLEGVNDSPEQARQLAKLLQGIRCKINLIPCNPFEKSAYRCSSQETINRFRSILYQSGFNTITRKTRGNDIAAACGQLAGSTIIE